MLQTGKRVLFTHNITLLQCHFLFLFARQKMAFAASEHLLCEDTKAQRRQVNAELWPVRLLNLAFHLTSLPLRPQAAHLLFFYYRTNNCAATPSALSNLVTASLKVTGRDVGMWSYVLCALHYRLNLWGRCTVVYAKKQTDTKAYPLERHLTRRALL